MTLNPKCQSHCRRHELSQKQLSSSSHLLIRGGVEDTRLEAKAKDTKKIRSQLQPYRRPPVQGQGQERSRTRPRTQAQVFSKKEALKKFFQ